jgi:hypothetical protein
MDGRRFPTLATKLVTPLYQHGTRNRFAWVKWATDRHGWAPRRARDWRKLHRGGAIYPRFCGLECRQIGPSKGIRPVAHALLKLR